MRMSSSESLKSRKPQAVVGKVINRAKYVDVDNSGVLILPSFLLDYSPSYRKRCEQAYRREMMDREWAKLRFRRVEF